MTLLERIQQEQIELIERVNMTDYNIGVIFQMLTEAFDSASLWRLCRDTKLLEPICNRVNRNAPINEVADEVIAYCRQQYILDELLHIVRNNRERQFGRFEPYLESFDGQPLLVSGVVSKTELSDLIHELMEWKLIHNDSQELLTALSIPFDYLTICRFRPDLDALEQAGYKWQELCVSKLRSVPDKWNLQYAYTPALDSLREQTLSLDEITRQLMRMEVRDPEFRPVYSQLAELKGTLWDVLTAADKRIMVLVEALQPIIGV